MPFYIQSFEDNRWCVNNEPHEISTGQVVPFDQEFEAAHFVQLGRAGAIGQFENDAQALAELERLVALADQRQKEAAANDAANAPPVGDAETKAVVDDAVETMTEAAPSAAKSSAKKKGK